MVTADLHHAIALRQEATFTDAGLVGLHVSNVCRAITQTGQIGIAQINVFKSRV